MYTVLGQRTLSRQMTPARGGQKGSLVWRRSWRVLWWWFRPQKPPPPVGTGMHHTQPRRIPSSSSSRQSRSTLPLYWTAPLCVRVVCVVCVRGGVCVCGWVCVCVIMMTVSQSKHRLCIHTRIHVYRCQLSWNGRDCPRFSTPVPCPLLIHLGYPGFWRLLLLSWATKLQ